MFHEFVCFKKNTTSRNNTNETKERYGSALAWKLYLFDGKSSKCTRKNQTIITELIRINYFLAGLGGADPFVLPAGGVLGISCSAFNSPTIGASLTAGDDVAGGVDGDVIVGVLGWWAGFGSASTLVSVSVSVDFGSVPALSTLWCNSISATLDIFRSLRVTVTVDTGHGVTAMSLKYIIFSLFQNIPDKELTKFHVQWNQCESIFFRNEWRKLREKLHRLKLIAWHKMYKILVPTVISGVGLKN